MELSLENTQALALDADAKLLVFQCSQEYGIHIAYAREVVGLQVVDPVPMMPHFMEGVMNLRGKIVPVMNLRKKLNMPEVEPTQETCIVVVDLQGEQMGIIVDYLIGVQSLNDYVTEDSPDLGSQGSNNFIQGVAKSGRRVILILDAFRLIEVKEED